MMLALLALATSQAAPLSPAELRFEEYVTCLQSSVTSAHPPSAVMASARGAVSSCSPERERMIAEAARLFTAVGHEHPRAEAERRAAAIDASVPAMILGRPVQIVQRSECASELKDRDQCLE